MDIAGYLELEEIDRYGGVCTVRAMDENTGRKVTIRYLEAAAPEPLVADRFASQHRHLLKQQHESILEVYLADERHFVLEEVTCNLGVLSDQRQLSAPEAGSVLQQVLQVVAHLESRVQSHGDLRPENLYLGPDECTIKVSNFWNYDRPAFPDAEMTRYCAPELMVPNKFGEPHGASFDLYAAGYAILEMALSKDEFVSLFRGIDAVYGQGVTWFQWHASEEPARSLVELRPDWPKELIAVIDGLTEKRISERIRSASEALERLGKWDEVPISFEGTSEDVVSEAVDSTKSHVMTTIRSTEFRPKRLFGTGPFLIGREKGVCDLPIRKKVVSRKHAVLCCFRRQVETADEIRLAWAAVDISGRKGTVEVDGRVATQKMLSEKVSMKVAGVSFEIEFHEEPACVDPDVPTKIAGFRVLGPPVHRGRLGNYYAGTWADNDNRLVAVLHVSQETAAELRFWRRMERDLLSTAAKKLQHPNILRYLRGVRGQQGIFLFAEWMDNGSLRERLTAIGGKLAEPDLKEAGCQLFSALRHLHHAGVVHRNIDPSTILFDHCGDAHLGGMLFAYMTEEERQASERSISVGLNESVLFESVYRSPEVVRGDVPNQGGDVYSLAACLFHATCGRPPYDGNTTREAIGNVLRGERRRIREIEPRAPKAVDEFFDRALAFDADSRHASVDECASEWVSIWG